MQLGEALDDGQPEPGAAMARAMGTALEAIEHRLLVVLGNADALILDGESDHGILPLAAKRDLAAVVGEADGVGEQDYTTSG